MDSYLAIAEKVLLIARAPLSAREILKRAYVDHLVPPHLYGKTQHKTLQARLSEDILLLKERSAFFRTRPGRFFLTCFLKDSTIPAKYRRPLVARRRKRELWRGPILSCHLEDIYRSSSSSFVHLDDFLDIIKNHKYFYAEKHYEQNADTAFVWSYVVVTRNSSILTYRSGRYREDRDTFLKKRSIGFFTPIIEADRTLFDQQDHGVVSAGIRAVMLDLDFPAFVQDSECTAAAELRWMILLPGNTGCTDLLSIVTFRCPEWFEPLTRRLALNDLRWLEISTTLNNLDDFDPWSRVVFETIGRTGVLGEIDTA